MAGQSQDVEKLIRDNLGGDEGSMHAVNPGIEELTRAWCNEKCAPELLPYNRLVDELLEQTTVQQANLVAMRPDVYIRGLYQLDIDRVRFVVASYLRARLGKIQRWYLHLESTPSMKARLSDHERTFLAEYSKSRATLLDSALLQHLPAGARSLTAGGEGGGGSGSGSGGGGEGGGVGEGTAEATLREGPSLKQHVFIRVIQDIENPAWAPNEEKINAGSSFILLYDAARADVIRGDVELR